MDHHSSFAAVASTTFQTESNFTSEKNISESGILVMTLFGGLMSVVSMYTSIALSTQLIKKNKARKKASKKILTHRIRASSTNWMGNLSLVASTLVVFRLVVDQVIFYSEDLSAISCKFMQFISRMLYSAAHFCVYLFFWFRQRSCYKNPSMAKLHNKFCRVLSAVILPLFLLLNVSGLILSAFLWSFEKTHDECDEKIETYLPLIALFVVSVIMQSTLLILFLYPLKSHSNFLHERDMLGQADKVLAKLIKRSVICTALCILADASAFTIAVSMDPNRPFILTNYIYNANLICNVICMVGSFADWRYRIAPWCEHRSKKYRSGSYVGSGYAASLKNGSNSAAGAQV